MAFRRKAPGPPPPPPPPPPPAFGIRSSTPIAPPAPGLAPPATPAASPEPARPPLPTPAHWFDPDYGWIEAGDLCRAVEAGDPDPLEAALRTIEDPALLELRIAIAGFRLARGPHLDAWIERHGDDSILPWCVHADVTSRHASKVRGGGYASTVAAEAWAEFFAGMRAADASLQQAARLDPTSPQPWTGLLRTARALQIAKEELDARFERGRRCGGPLPAAEDQYLQGICAKWSGSHDEMFAYARAVSAEAPVGSYRHRHLAVARYEHAMLQPEGSGAWTDAEAQAEVQLAADRCFGRPDFGSSLQEQVTLNWLALITRRFGLADLSRLCHDRIGDRYGFAPWTSFYDDAAKAVRFERKALGLPLH